METKLEDIITSGFVTAMERAMERQISAGEFRTLALQTLLGNFIAANELGTEGVPAEIRLKLFEDEINRFRDAGLAIYKKMLTEESPTLSSVPSQPVN